MSSSQSPDKKYSTADLKSHKGFEDGKLYEKLTLTLLVKRGYELSKRNSEFRHFSIGKEVSVGKDAKFDDIIFKYEDQDKAKNLVFVQIKHKQDDYKIDSQILSAEASTAKGGRDGGMRRDFNLQKYFISYLNDREQLKCTTCEELRNGKIKYVVLFTNVGLDTEDLIRNEFSLDEAPDDILKLFTLKIPPLRTPHSARCIQLNNISEDIRKILQKSSDLHRLARVLAGYVVWKNYREKNILGTDESPVKHYHLMLGKHVIEKSGHVKNISTGKKKKILYCDAKFKDDFIYSNEKGPKQELLKAIFEAVKELDTSKKNMSDSELKDLLKGVEFKVVSHFGKSKSGKKDFPDKWLNVNDDDINDFLKCLVFFVNQPSVTDLLTHMYSEKETFLEDTRLGKALDNMNPKFRDRIEKDLGIYEKDSYEKVWLSGETVFQFVQEQQEAVNVSIVTLIYEDEVMQYGRFNTLGKLTATLDSFLNYEKREEEHHLLRNVLCIRTPMTLFSTIKILQYLNSTNYREKNGQISTKMIDLGFKEFRERIEKAFRSESHNLLTIECRHTISETFVNTFCGNLFGTIKRNPNKKIILIIQQNEHTILTEKFKSDLQNLFKRQPDVYVEETDDIKLQDFEPVENPLKKEIIVFQGQKQKLSLATLTGITNWNYFIDYLYQANIRNKQDVIDIMTLILTRDGLEIGSKPLGTSSLEGAYAKISEEINVETLANKLLFLGSDNDTDSATAGVSKNNNYIYIVSGINETDEEERIVKLIECLGQGRQKSKIVRDKKQFENLFRYIVSVNKLQIFDDQFKDENFYQLCQHNPDKQVFWICVKYEMKTSKFYLQQLYNPKFYLKRTFKIIDKVVIQKKVKELLMKDSLSKRFIFHCDKKQLMDCLDECEIERFQRNDKLMLFTEEAVAKATFEDISRISEVETVHWLKIEDEQIIWCNSHGSLSSLQIYIDENKNKTSLVEEDNLLKSIKDRKILIIADDPGMGKTTTLTNLFESNEITKSILETHWVIKIHLKDQLEFVRDTELLDGICDVDNVVKFLSKFDLKLSHSLSNILLRIALDKNKSFSKPLLFAFDGFDEVLDVEVRNKIISLFKILKDRTAAKLWITTRLHYKEILENELSTFAIEFNPMTDQEKLQYIKKYLKKHLYLILNEEKYMELFGNNDKKQDNKDIQVYITAFLHKMKSIFRGDIARFIGTPLQLWLMLEGSARHFKNWVENDDGKIPVFNYLGNDVYEIYENFLERKYDVYFQKVGIRGQTLQGFEKFHIDRYHKDFAASKILEVNENNDFKQFKDILLLVGVIRPQGSYLEFIHKTFEEFFASKMFFEWIKSVPETPKQEYLLKVILLKPDYQLIRTFMNLQLQKLSEPAAKDGQQNDLDKSLEYYGHTAKKLLNEENSPLINEIGTPLHIAVHEGNKEIACFLLSSLKPYPGALRKFLFAGECTTDLNRERKGTALHIACMRDDVEIVRVLLNVAEEISKVTLQEFLKCLDGELNSALVVAAKCTHNVEIFTELLSRANNKLELILTKESALSEACFNLQEEFVDLLLNEFKHEKHSLKQLLLNDSRFGNPLYYAKSTTVIEKLVSAAKLVEDNNETLKNLLLPEESDLPLNSAVWDDKIDIVEKLLNIAKDMDDDNHTLKQLLLKERYGTSPLHVAAKRGRGDIIKLLLETADGIGIEMLEKLITAVDEEGKTAIQLLVEHGHETIFEDSFKVLKNKHRNIWKKVKEMFDYVPLESRLYLAKLKLIMAVDKGDIQEVRDILNDVQNSSVNREESLRILLLVETSLAGNILNIASTRGHSIIMKELLACAMEIYDDNSQNQLTLMGISVASALHVAAKNGHVDVIKLLLKTTADLGLDMLEKVITAVDYEGKNAIELMFEHGHERIFDDFFKMLEEDKYQNIREKVMQKVDNVPLESRLYWDKRKLITAIELDDIKEVKEILIKVKNSTINRNESIKILLLADKSFKRNTLHIACLRGNSEIIKELLSCAKEIDDNNHTLKQLLLNETSGESAVRVAIGKDHVDVIKLLFSTAADLGIDMLEELNVKEGTNAMVLMFENVSETISHSVKVLLEDQNFQKTLMETFDNALPKSRLSFAEDEVD